MPFRVLMLLWIGATGCSLRLPQDSGSGQCGTAAVLRDDFDGAVLSPLWDYNVPPDLYAEPTADSGDAVVAFDNTDDVTVDGAIFSRFGYDVRAQTVSLRVSAVAEEGDTWFGIGSNTTVPEFAISQDSGQMIAWYGDTQVATRAYEPTDRVWSFTFAGDVVRASAGSDVDAEPLLEMLMPPAMDPTSALLVFGVTAPGGASGEARFDGVDLERQPAAACPVQRLSDDFEDPASLSRLWPRFEEAPLCDYSYDNGSLTVSTEGSECDIETRSAFSLAGSEIALELQSLPSLSDAGYFYLRLFTAQDEEVYFEYHNRFEAGVCADPPAGCFISDEVEPQGDERFLRIREDGERVHFEVGSGGDYRSVFSSVANIDLSTVGVRIGIVDDQPASVALAGVNAD